MTILILTLLGILKVPSIHKRIPWCAFLFLQKLYIIMFSQRFLGNQSFNMKEKVKLVFVSNKQVLEIQVIS